MGAISMVLIGAAQHLYFIVAAPAVFVPLGIVVLGAGLLLRVLLYPAIALGAAFGIVGAVYLLDLTLPGWVLVGASVQLLWWVAAAVSLIVRGVGRGAGDIGHRRRAGDAAHPVLAPERADVQ